MSSGVIFEGNFCHIVESIFFYLDPSSLLACSLVCTSWNNFIRERIFHTPSGERRILYNWLHRPPVETRIDLRPHPEMRDPCPFRIAPSAVVANLNYVFVAVHGNIDLYDRSSGRYLKCIHDGKDSDRKWILGLTSKYLVAKPLKLFLNAPGERMEVFRVGDFGRVPMKDNYPMDMHRVFFFRMASADTLTLKCFKNSRSSIICFRISETTLKYQFLWSVSADFSCLNIDHGQSLILSSYNAPFMSLAMYRINDGTLKRELVFDSGEYVEAVSVTSARSRLGVALIAKADHELLPAEEEATKIILWDLESGRPMRVLAINCGEEISLSLSTDATVGILTLMASGRIWVWDICDLLSEINQAKEVNEDILTNVEKDWKLTSVEDDLGPFKIVSRPDRIIETTDFGGEPRKVCLSNGLIYGSIHADGKWFLVNLNFWGKL